MQVFTFFLISGPDKEKSRSDFGAAACFVQRNQPIS
jgi:hypothetical protein